MSDNNNSDSTNSNETDETNNVANAAPPLQAKEILRLLHKHGVKFVVIGGYVAELRNFDIGTTVDLDITPQRTTKNLERLAQFMEELNVGLLTSEEGGTWFPRWPTENWASYDTLHLTSAIGLLDIVFVPAGVPGGYDELLNQTDFLDVEGTKVRVITEITWIKLKKITNRKKDNLHLQRYFSSGGSSPSG
jgi:predicted nucleotidyltransferase